MILQFNCYFDTVFNSCYWTVQKYHSICNQWILWSEWADVCSRQQQKTTVSNLPQRHLFTFNILQAQRHMCVTLLLSSGSNAWCVFFWETLYPGNLGFVSEKHSLCTGSLGVVEVLPPGSHECMGCFWEALSCMGMFREALILPRFCHLGVISDFTLACVHNEHGKGKLVWHISHFHCSDTVTNTRAHHSVSVAYNKTILFSQKY